MPLIVTREGAAPESLPVREALDALAPHVDLSDLFPALKRQEAFVVTFRDGTRGTISGVDGPIKPFEADSGQTTLALLPSPPREFDLRCKLLVPVDVQIFCQARNQGHAQTVVQEVFKGIRRVESGFTATINTDEMSAQFKDIERAIRAGDLTMLRHHRLVIDQTLEIYPELTK